MLSSLSQQKQEAVERKLLVDSGRYHKKGLVLSAAGKLTEQGLFPTDYTEI